MAAPPPNPDFARDVSDSFARQGLMTLLGARLSRVEHGLVEIEFAARPDLTQQDGFIHAGVLAATADSAGGYAALSAQPAATAVLTAEFKLHFLRPARGDGFRARGRVIRSGRTLSTCEISVEALAPEGPVLCAWGSQSVACRPIGAPAP